MQPFSPNGPGLDNLTGAIIEDEIGWGCSGIATSLNCNGLASAPLMVAASEELKKKYLGMLCEEPKLASFCLTEPDAGSDVAGMKTTAVKKGNHTNLDVRSTAPCDCPAVNELVHTAAAAKRTDFIAGLTEYEHGRRRLRRSAS